VLKVTLAIGVYTFTTAADKYINDYLEYLEKHWQHYSRFCNIKTRKDMNASK